MAFKLTPKEKRYILDRRGKSIAAESDDKYYDIIADIRAGLSETTDGIRSLEDYIELKDSLREAIEKDFDRLEKLHYEMKSIIKRLNKKKVIRK